MGTMFNQVMLDRMLQEDLARQKRQLTAWEHYYGEYPKLLKPLLSDPKAEDNTVVNYLRLIVDQSATMLFGFNLDFEVNGQRDTPEERWLRDCLNAGQAGRKLIGLAINGGVCGHAFLAMSPPLSRRGHEFPSFTLWDPASVTVRWDQTDFELVDEYAYSWTTVGEGGALEARTRRRVVVWEEDHWVIEDQIGDALTQNWKVLDSEV